MSNWRSIYGPCYWWLASSQLTRPGRYRVQWCTDVSDRFSSQRICSSALSCPAVPPSLSWLGWDLVGGYQFVILPGTWLVGFQLKRWCFSICQLVPPPPTSTESVPPYAEPKLTQSVPSIAVQCCGSCLAGEQLTPRIFAIGPHARANSNVAVSWYFNTHNKNPNEKSTKQFNDASIPEMHIIRQVSRSLSIGWLKIRALVLLLPAKIGDSFNSTPTLQPAARRRYCY